jgi:1-acyl-sn-glycerol-3-phosphate acyltransferase
MAASERIEEDRRDPSFIRAHLDALSFFFEHYHRVEVSGLEEVPPGRVLIVGNHNGGIMSPDMFALMAAWFRTFGVDAPAYGLMHDLPFRVPVVGDALARFGAVHAHPDNARRLLERDAKVLVYPGGDLDAFRPWSRRHEIVFGARRGFIRIALSTGAPIVPVVAAGAHEGCFVVSDGRTLARALGLKRLRVEAIPIAFGLPWGFFVGPAPYLPVPLRIRIRVLPPISWPHLSRDAAYDEACVDECRTEVIATMQRALDELAAEGGFGPRLPAMLEDPRRNRRVLRHRAAIA